MRKYLITGLGNPGTEYEDTRHNVGFWVLDALADKLGVSFKQERYGMVARATIKGRPVLLLKPATFMNLSGKAIRYWMEKENIPVSQTLTVVDDIALPTGMLRMKIKGSDGGHNGLADIIEKLQTTRFPRLRVGVGNTFSKGRQIDYVLGRWDDDEVEIIRRKLPKSVDMIQSFIMIGPDRTMNLFNEKQQNSGMDTASENS
jgi:PTH1 family peptidyl-tRNA hydrolase